MSGAPDGAAWRPPHAAALAAVVLVALIHLVPFAGYLTDDTFIHLQFAKHLIRGEGFSFNAGEPTYGATSPLWVLLLAAAGALVPGAGATPPSAGPLPALAVIAKLWGAFFTGAAVILMAALARTLRWEPRWAIAAALLVALHAWSARWAISGMETPLALALAALSLLLLARALLEGRSAFPAGLALGLAFLARPEFLLLAILAAAAIAWGSAPEARARRVGGLLAGGLLAAGPWLAYAWVSFHRLLPNTSGAKAGAWLDPALALSALRESIRSILAADFVPVAIAIAVLAWLQPWRAMGETPGRRAFWASVLAWPIVLVVGFAAGGVQVVSRYLIPAVPAIALIGLASLRHATRAWAPRSRSSPPRTSPSHRS